MPSRRDIIGLRELVLAISLAALVQAITQPVRAEVRISGQMDALKVEAREASVEEVLAALRASVNLQYRTSDALNRVMTGTYNGSLQRVVARLLEGRNYVMRIPKRRRAHRLRARSGRQHRVRIGASGGYTGRYICEKDGIARVNTLVECSRMDRHVTRWTVQRAGFQLRIAQR